MNVLRIARANGGETLAALVERSSSAWSAERTAIANALDSGARLEKGRAVKIAVRAPYRRTR
jgi:hypothetical protein